MVLLHEAGGEVNAALISYRKALNAYREYEMYYGVRTPRKLVYDFMDACKYLGFWEEFEKAKRLYGIRSYSRNVPKNYPKSEIIAFISLGNIAHKEERFWEIPSPAGPILRIGYPEFERTPYEIRSAEIMYQQKNKISSSH